MQPSLLIARIVDGIAKRRMLGLKMAMQRVNDFPSELEAKLTGIALDDDARAFANKQMDLQFARNTRLGIVPLEAQEVIIGGGFHSAVYAATRVLLGKPVPVILESRETIGGSFAIPGDGTYPGVFNLNSRNRRGLPGISGDNEAQLNYLPGAPIQASALSNAEYQTNADIAFIVRLTLAQYAPLRTYPDSNVAEVVYDSVPGNDPQFLVRYDSPYGRKVIRAGRVLDARGLGEPRLSDVANGKSVVTFPQFMQRMAGIWPLRGLRNVAVIGGGDSGKCAVESLLGLGPNAFMAAAQLDSVNRVDWYARGIDSDYDDYCRNNRGRYRAIGRYLRPDKMGNRKLNVFNTGEVYPLSLPGDYSLALVNGRAYDLVIVAAGNDAPNIEGLNWFYSQNVYSDLSRTRVIAKSNEEDYGDVKRYRIGPRAAIDFDREELDNGVSDIDANRVAMFRLAPRTAALAIKLK